MIDLCLTGVFRVVKYAGRQMLKQQSGSIILSSTVDALVGCAGLDSYTAAKGGVTALTRSLAAGLAPDGIRVNAIAPSFVSTEPPEGLARGRRRRARRSSSCTCSRSRRRRRSRRSSSSSRATSRAA